MVREARIEAARPGRPQWKIRAQAVVPPDTTVETSEARTLGERSSVAVIAALGIPYRRKGSTLAMVTNANDQWTRGTKPMTAATPPTVAMSAM